MNQSGICQRCGGNGKFNILNKEGELVCSCICPECSGLGDESSSALNV